MACRCTCRTCLIYCGACVYGCHRRSKLDRIKRIWWRLTRP